MRGTLSYQRDPYWFLLNHSHRPNRLVSPNKTDSEREPGAYRRERRGNTLVDGCGRLQTGPEGTRTSAVIVRRQRDLLGVLRAACRAAALLVDRRW